MTETSFNRTRKLLFSVLLTYFLNLTKGSYQQELDNFFAVSNSNPIPAQVITKSALTREGFVKKGHSVLCEGNTVKYAWIKKHSQDFSIAALCQFMNVSRSCYYKWLDSPKTQREKENNELFESKRIAPPPVQLNIKPSSLVFLKEKDDGIIETLAQPH